MDILMAAALGLMAWFVSSLMATKSKTWFVSWVFGLILFGILSGMLLIGALSVEDPFPWGALIIAGVYVLTFPWVTRRLYLRNPKGALFKVLNSLQFVGFIVVAGVVFLLVLWLLIEAHGWLVVIVLTLLFTLGVAGALGIEFFGDLLESIGKKHNL